MGTVIKGGNVVELEPAIVERVDLRIEDARIVARGPDLQPQPDDEVVALSGKLVFPGLVSAHHRLHMSLGRGMPEHALDSYQDALEKVRWRYEDALDQLSCDTPDTTQVYRIAICGSGDTATCLRDWPPVRAPQNAVITNKVWGVAYIDPLSGRRAAENAVGTLNERKGQAA